MKKYLVIALLCLFSLGAKAQDYNWAIGVRGGGNDSGVTLKHILSDYNALEFTYNFQYPRDRMLRASVFSLLYEWNQPVINDGFLLYYGLGAHIGAATMTKEDSDNYGSMVLGVAGVVGRLDRDQVRLRRHAEVAAAERVGRVAVVRVAGDDAGDVRATYAFDMFAQRVKRYIGGYMAEMGGCDLLLFTGGIGENAWFMRHPILEGLECLGIKIDFSKNDNGMGEDIILSTPDSKMAVVVVTTDEEYVIASDTYALVK